MNVFEPSGIKTTKKPWGYELLWARTEQYVGKILHVEPGQSLSLQYHQKKEETLLLIKGSVILTLEMNGERHSVKMIEGQAFHIPPGMIHRIEASSPSDIVEVSTPELEDVVRLEDRYGREGTSTP